MAAMTMLNNSMPKILSSVLLLEQLQRDYPKIDFVAANRFSWHGGSRVVSYRPESLSSEKSTHTLLHEVGHALLKHADYTTDIQLLQMEVAAWVKAHELAEAYGITLDQDHIEDCTDSYRDWLHVRSTCPTCYARSLQINQTTYRCHNCQTTWHVTRSRLCRPYRRRNERI